MIADARRCHSGEGEYGRRRRRRRPPDPQAKRKGDKKKTVAWWVWGGLVKKKKEREINKGQEKEGGRGGGGRSAPHFSFRESNQIPLIAHYLKRLSGAVMRLRARPRLRDFLVYQCWRVL